MNESPSQAETLPDVGDPVEPRENGGRDMENERLAGTAEGPVQGGGEAERRERCMHCLAPPDAAIHNTDPAISGEGWHKYEAEPEPDVLERLGDRSDKAGSFEHRWQWKSIATDALAEVERLESELGIEQEFKAQAIEARNTAQAKLRAITEAEPVKWTRVGDSQPPPHARYEVLRRETGPFVATPCYGMHEPWWVPLTCDLYSPGSTAFKMEDEDLWRPWIIAPKGDTE